MPREVTAEAAVRPVVVVVVKPIYGQAGTGFRKSRPAHALAIGAAISQFIVSDKGP
jgi:hypothetical protein